MIGAPDRVCEVISPSSERLDRGDKMTLYAEHGVAHLWLIDPLEKTLEAYPLNADGTWGDPLKLQDRDRGRIVPFDAIELALTVLWAE